MVHAILTFDTLAYASKLKEAGFTEKQAEVQAETMADILNNDLATKHDLQQGLKGLKQELTHEMKELKQELKHEIREMDHRFKHELKEMDLRLEHKLEQVQLQLLIKLTSAMVVIIGLFSGLLGVFLKLMH